MSLKNKHLYSCKYKTRYKTQYSASQGIKALLRKGYHEKRKRFLKTYKCEFCGNWHVGHSTETFYRAWATELSGELFFGQTDWWPVVCAYSGKGGVQ